MRLRATCWALALFTTWAGAAPISSYGTARAAWEKTKDDKAAAAYLQEFIQFNNAMKLDSKGGCYSQPGGQVKLMLLITRQGRALGQRLAGFQPDRQPQGAMPAAQLSRRADQGAARAALHCSTGL